MTASNALTVANSTRESEWTEPRRQIYVPKDILDRYVGIAMRPAIPRQLDDGTWYGDLSAFPGVWASGESPKQCLDILEEVLREWLILKLVDGDRDIPVVDDLDLAVLL